METIENIRAITFDLWDTIILATDYSDVRFNYLYNVLKAQDFDISISDIKAAFEVSLAAFSQLWREQNQYFTADARVDLILQKLNVTLPDATKKDITKRFQETILVSPPPLIPGAFDVLTKLHKHSKIGLVCDSGMSPGVVVRKVLKHHAILPYFHTTIFSDEIGITKPHPRIFSEALARMQVAPNEAVHIGDLLRTDIAGAKAIGMKAIWFNSNAHAHAKKQDQRSSTVKPDHTISSLTQLLEIINH